MGVGKESSGKDPDGFSNVQLPLDPHTHFCCSPDFKAESYAKYLLLGEEGEKKLERALQGSP